LQASSTNISFSRLGASASLSTPLCLKLKMYEDSWYNFVPDSRSKNDDATPHSSKHRQKDSLLKQPNVSVSPCGLRDVRNSSGREIINYQNNPSP